MTVMKKDKKTVTSQIPRWLKPWIKPGSSTSRPQQVNMDELAEQLREWAEKADGIKIAEFLVLKKVTYDNFHSWCESFQQLADAKEYAKAIIGARRERKGLEGKYNASIVLSTMSIYDKEFKDNYEWKVKLAKENKEQSETKIVVIEKYPESPMVPQKKEID